MKSFSKRVIASWIKLLVIMYANKISAKKETIFHDKASSFDLSILFLWNSQKVISSRAIKWCTQDQRLKLTQKIIEKTILILQRLNFFFQNTRQSKDYICWMACVGSLIKKAWFFKILSKTDISLISFQQLYLNKHDLWNVQFDFRTRKIVKQEEHR